MRKFAKRVIVVGSAVAVMGLSAGAAFAYWTTSGSGTGSAATGTSQAVTVTQLGSVSGLTPGGVAQAVDFKITNPMATRQYVNSVLVSISSISPAQADSGKPACTAADYTLVQPTAISADLASGDTTFNPSGATIALKDTALNQDNCKGATVNLAFAAS